MKLSLFLVAGVLALSAGCSDDDNGSRPATGLHRVQLSFEGLEPLHSGFHYEGWVIVDEVPIATGKFNVGAGGVLMDLDGNAIANCSFDVSDDLTGATAFVLTIEPSADSDPAPAATHILAGDVANNQASLAAGHGAAFGDDFTSTAGQYILATPTNGPETNEKSGVWFLSLAGGSPAAGLDLPTLPDGWRYEGWAVIAGTPVTSGTFVSPSGTDDSAVYSGPEDSPPFPGEDYVDSAPGGLSFPTDLSGATAVISVEPYPDDDPAPFALKPLVGQVPAEAIDHVTYALSDNAGAFPTGTAMITQ